MQTFYILERTVSYYDSPSESQIVAMFADKSEALQAQSYASDNWSDWHNTRYSGLISYRIREASVFTSIDEMQYWNDYPERVLN